MWKRFIIGITLGMIMLVTAFAFDSNLERENVLANIDIGDLEKDRSFLIPIISEGLKDYEGIGDIEINEHEAIIIHTSYDKEDPMVKDVLHTAEYVVKAADLDYDLELELFEIHVKMKDGKVLK